MSIVLLRQNRQQTKQTQQIDSMEKRERGNPPNKNKTVAMAMALHNLRTTVEPSHL